MEVFRRYNQIIAEVASETGSVLIDAEAVMLADNAHFNDSVHFKDAGSQGMAERVSEALHGNPDWPTGRFKWVVPMSMTRVTTVLWFGGRQCQFSGASKPEHLMALPLVNLSKYYTYGSRFIEYQCNSL